MFDSTPALIPLYKYSTLVAYALVDAADFEQLSQARWRLSSQGYAVTAQTALFDGQTLMHRVITRAEKGLVVDHINHIRTDNRRANLRNCTQQENNKNRRSLNTKSGFRGVRRHSDGQRWSAYVTLGGKFLSLGLYDTAEDAAYAYDSAARQYHGPMAYLNFPEVQQHIGVDWKARAEEARKLAEQHRFQQGQQGRLSNDAVREIRQKHALGADDAQLAEEYGTSVIAIWRIINRATYKNL